MKSKKKATPPRPDRFTGTADEVALPGDPDFPRPRWLDEPKAQAKPARKAPKGRR